MVGVKKDSCRKKEEPVTTETDSAEDEAKTEPAKEGGTGRF